MVFVRLLLFYLAVSAAAHGGAAAEQGEWGQDGSGVGARRTLHQFGFFGGSGPSFFDFLGDNRAPAAPEPSSPTPAPVPQPQPQPAAQQVPAPQQQQQQPSSNRFTPAPVSYNYAQVPSYSPTGPVSGPVQAATLTAVAPPGECQTLGAVLSSIPEASQWLGLMRQAGLDAVLLNDRNARATLLVPVNSAFNAAIDGTPLRPERTMQELINNSPDIVTPLVGYSVLRGLWPSGALTPGARVPTSNTIDKVNQLMLAVEGSNPIRLVGMGSAANVLQADVAACGPSVVHLIDQILLPFTFDQGPTDAILGTQVAAASRPSAPTTPGRVGMSMWGR